MEEGFVFFGFVFRRYFGIFFIIDRKFRGCWGLLVLLFKVCRVFWEGKEGDFNVLVSGFEIVRTFEG